MKPPREIFCPRCNKKVMEVRGQIAPDTVAVCGNCWHLYVSAYNLTHTKPKYAFPKEIEALFGKFK
jgi:hypothetical protein